MSTRNAIAQARWYERQKNAGVVYGLYINGLLYVGSTTNSLKKRLWQHRAGNLASTREAVKNTEGPIVIFLLEQLKKGDSRYEREQFWIDDLKPDLNKQAAVRRRPKATGVYKGGVEFEGVFYPTKLALWRARGKVPYGTFRSRQNRNPNNIAYALGLGPSMFKIKSNSIGHSNLNKVQY